MPTLISHGPLIIARKTVDGPIAESISMGVSQSEFSTYDLCHYRWYLERVLMLTSILPEFVLTVGTSMHSGMDWLYKTKGKKVGVPPLEFNKLAKLTPEDQEEARYWHKVLTALIENYRLYYKDDFSTVEVVSLEQVVRVEIEGINLCGALDLAALRHNAIEIWDHKTKGMKSANSSAVDEWRTRFQFLLYTVIWNILNPKRKAKYFMANVIHKPALRLKQGEHPAALVARIRHDIAQRQKEYFKRERFPVPPNLLQAFMNNFLMPRIENFKMLQRVKPGTGEYQALVMHRNSAACWSYGRQCPFYAHCHSGKTIEELAHVTKRKAKHEHYEEKAD